MPDVYSRPIIGIVGGVGPHAGYDLALKILSETAAKTDQDHIPVILSSESDIIGDRTGFLAGDTTDDPGEAIATVIGKLAAAGATVVGIPCNTAHAEPILSTIREGISPLSPSPALVNMIEEVVQFLKSNVSNISRVGLLSTLGTARSGIYQQALESGGFGIVGLPDNMQEKIHQAVYDPAFGIKAASNPVSNEATEILVSALEWYRTQGVSNVILGCTEIPLALPVETWKDIRLIDATRILARALIRETYPAKLR